MNFLAGLGGAMGGAGFNFGTLSPFAQNQQNYSNQSKLSKQNYEQQRGLNQQNYDLQTGAFTKYGLPEFMANMGGMQAPPTIQHLGGLNYARGPPMFSSGAPSNPNPYQQMAGWANYLGDDKPVKNRFTEMPQVNPNVSGPPPIQPPSANNSSFFPNPTAQSAGRGRAMGPGNMPDYIPPGIHSTIPGSYNPLEQAISAQMNRNRTY